MAYLPSLKLFLPRPAVEKFAKQANLSSHRVFVRVFFLCSSWMYSVLMGLSKAINLFEICLWFMANFRENLSKLVETLQASVNEDWGGARNNVNAFANWLIHSDSWFLIGWNGFPHVRESRFAIAIGWRNFRMSFSCDRFYPKISISMKEMIIYVNTKKFNNTTVKYFVFFALLLKWCMSYKKDSNVKYF